MNIKSFLLGAAAAISMAGAASAADLPIAEPVEYVRVCDAFGAGFFFIPGTDTCLRISGYVRVDTWVMSDNWTARTGQGATIGGDNGPGVTIQNLAGPTFTVAAFPAGSVGIPAPISAGGGAVGYNPTNQFATVGAAIPAGTPSGAFIFSASDLNDQYGIGVRALLRFDARSRTEWGVLRSFFEFAANSNNSADNGAALQIRYGFVQFGPITAGITDSFFNGDNGPTFLNHVGDRSTRQTVLAYTAAFGNGISATVSLEDPQQSSGVGGSTTVFNNGAGVIVPVGIAGPEGWVRQGIRHPDVVGVIRVQQAWGAAQINGVIAHREMRNTTCFNAGLGGFCDVSDTGWAVGGMLRVDVPTIGAGSNILLKASFGEGGGIHYLGNVGGFGYIGYSFAPTLSAGGALQPNFDNRVGVNTAWAVYGHLQVFFTPAIRAAIMASYVDFDYDYGGFSTGSFIMNIGRSYTISGQIVWSPVRNLDLGLEVFYLNNRYEVYNGSTLTAGTLAPGGTARASDDGWGAIFRIQRSF